MTYSRSSKRFLLLYTDGSSDEVPVDEVEDHLPLRLQFKAKKRPNKRRAETLRGNAAQSPIKRPRLSASKAKPTSQNEPKRADKLEVMSHFVQDTLWALTTVLDVSEEKQQALLTTLNTRNEQPFAALEQYAKEGGLDALHQTLLECASGEKVACDETNAAESEVSLVTQDSSGKTSPPIPARKSSSLHHHISRCDEHLRELLRGKAGGSFSPKPTQPKEQCAPKKPETNLKKSRHKNPSNAPAGQKTVATTPVDFVPATQESEDEVDGARSAHRRLRFGTISTFPFDKHASVHVFHLQMKRAGRKRMHKPLRKSVLKPSPETSTNWRDLGSCECFFYWKFTCYMLLMNSWGLFTHSLVSLSESRRFAFQQVTSRSSLNV
ncbi:hypothetical protein V7S43_006531 [Phytophthora oleae]|uniref:Uncharacterized protein n=1 Tax=Phytophthora oleae TaxID=2107226 RepID=A0ABD3FNF9_9STRA